MQRHVDGIRLLTKKGVAVNRIYVLFGGKDRYLSGPFSVQLNAIQVAEALRFWDPKIIHWDPTSEEDVGSHLTRIINATRQEFGNEEEIYVDISSTTKTAIVVSILFTMLFGLKVYHVKAAANYALLDRTSRLYGEMLQDELVVKQLRDAIRTTKDDDLGKVVGVLTAAQSRAHHFLTTESRGANVVQVSGLGRALVNFTDNDKQVMMHLSRIPFETLSDLAEVMGKGDSAVAYVVEKLIDWGLVKGLELTPMGKGIAHGLTNPELDMMKLDDLMRSLNVSLSKETQHYHALAAAE